MPKFVPVTDTEKPKSEQSFYSDELLAHRQFDMPHAVINSTSAGSSNAQEKRGWTQGEVGWGNLNKYGSDAADNGAQVLRHAEGDHKMVKNEKGLWVKVKSIISAEKKGEIQGKGRGGGIPVFDKYRQDLENKNSDDEGSEAIRPDDKRFEDASTRKELKDKRSYRDHRDRSNSDRSASPPRRSHSDRDRSKDRGRDRERDRSDRNNRDRSRDRRRDEKERDNSRSRRTRSRSSHKDKRRENDRYNRARDDSRERYGERRRRSESRERHCKRSKEYSDSDSDDERRNKERDRKDRPRKHQRKTSPSPSPPKIKHHKPVETKEKQILSDEKNGMEDETPQIQITAVQVLNHFHEVFSAKSSKRIEQIGELFHADAKIQSLRPDHKLYLKGRQEIQASFQKTQAANVTPSKRIYIEVDQFLRPDSSASSQLVTYACDFHRAGTSPGLGDVSKDTVLLFECQDRFIVNVWGMNDADHLSQNEDLTEDVVYESKVWGLIEAVIQEKWSNVIQREKIDLKLVSHFHNYDKMEVWGM